MTADDRAAHRYAVKNMALICAVSFCFGVLLALVLGAIA